MKIEKVAVPAGVRGDGISDDTIALQAFINRAAASGGDEVVLPSGRFLICAPLTWCADDVYLRGNGATTIVASSSFGGDALIKIGRASETLHPTYRGGVSGLRLDMNLCGNPDLIGLQLVQTWWTTIRDIEIVNPLGLSVPRQTAFQISAGATEKSKPMVNFACNIHVDNLQINGSFKNNLSHVSGVPSDPFKAQVNRVKYFGGRANGCGMDKAGATGARFEVGDTTRVYGFALEDIETGVFIGTQNQGPFDFPMEKIAKPYVFGFPEIANQDVLMARVKA